MPSQCDHDRDRRFRKLCPACGEDFYPKPAPGTAPYCRLYIARGQMEILRGLVAKASTGLAESNPKVRLLKHIDRSLAGEEEF